MRRLYDDPEAITFGELGTQENWGSTPESTQEILKCTQESTIKVQNKGESSIENHKSSIEISKSGIETASSTIENGNSITETPQSGIEKLLTSSDFLSSSSETKIKNLLRVDDSLTIIEMAKLLEMSKSGVQKITDRLRAEGRLVREGSTKAGRWIVKD